MSKKEEPILDCIVCKGKNLGNNQVRLYTAFFSICWKCEEAIAKGYNRKNMKLSTYYPHETRK